MNTPYRPSPLSRWRDNLENLFFRFANSLVPAQWFLASVPSDEERSTYNGKLTLELVSHCWNYSHLMIYHLSSFVNYPPTKVDVTVTAFYSKEDTATQAMLDFFGKINVPGVTWNWQPLPKEQLFRRAIGRNKAALATKANWIWYIDCDLIFHKGCLDSLATALQGRNDILLFPQQESTTSLLEESNPLLTIGYQPQVVDIDTSQFKRREITRAVGAFQITHGDVARACGYCNNIRVYQTPSEHWRKTYEDRAYRWLLRTQGTSIHFPGIYRIRHISKGRYKKDTRWSKLRSYVRVTESRINEQKDN